MGLLSKHSWDCATEMFRKKTPEIKYWGYLHISFDQLVKFHICFQLHYGTDAITFHLLYN